MSHEPHIWIVRFIGELDRRIAARRRKGTVAGSDAVVDRAVSEAMTEVAMAAQVAFWGATTPDEQHPHE